MNKLVIELKKDEYILVKHLITDEEIQIICLAIINQDIKGRIWVDNVSNPKNAMMVDNIWVTYLLGKPDNNTFNLQAAEIIKKLVFPNRLADEDTKDAWILVLYSDSWISKIETEMGISDGFIIDIWHYKLEGLKDFKWREKIPNQHKVEKVNEEFLLRTYLKNHERVTNWITKRWKSPADFFKRGYCFCLVKNDKEIVSWAISEWATENYILMGLNTDEQYQRRGCATIVTAAAAEYCKLNKKDVRWFCSSTNTASWKTAEKIGFRNIREQKIIVGEFE